MTGNKCALHAVDTKAQVSAVELLEAVNNAERERAAAPGQIPIGQWAALKVQADLNLSSQQLTSQLQLSIPSQAVSASGNMDRCMVQHLCWTLMLFARVQCTSRLRKLDSIQDSL